MNKNKLKRTLRTIENDSQVLIDGTRSLYIDRDIVELVEDFRKLAVHKNTSVEIEQFGRQDSRLRGLGNGQLSQAVAVESGMGPGKLRLRSDFSSTTAQGQKPEFLWIGCSDSRVPAEDITGCEPGELIVHRNIANQVVPNDLNTLAVLQYGITVLKISHVIVCGHYNCGGAAHAMKEGSGSPLEDWLEQLRALRRSHAPGVQHRLLSGSVWTSAQLPRFKISRGFLCCATRGRKAFSFNCTPGSTI